MSFLNNHERDTLTAICETLIPALPGDTPIARYQAPELVTHLEDALERATDETAQRDLKLLLKAFGLSAFNGITVGKWKSLRQMSLSEREALLFSWANSRLFVQRKAFQGIKRMALFLAYSNPMDDSKHPIWSELQYPGPPGGAADTPKTIIPFEIQNNRTLETDVLIIGSGAGGGVVAGELACAGHDVIVVEKGDYRAEADFSGNELKSTEAMFEKYGALTTADTAMMVLAGATLGGGTTVNWSASFRTPEPVLQEWANTYGFKEAATPEYQRSLDAVIQRTNISTDESHPNANNRLFAEGCEKLGYQVGVIPRNVKGCEDCGFCNYGCSFGAKQGTLKTYLQDAYEKDARIIVRAQVRRVMHENGQVTGAIVEATDKNGQIHTLTIRAKVVVVSAGSLHTPVILQRSGLQNSQIGANLHLHPATVIFSLFDQTVKTWVGAPMTRVSQQFGNLDGRGYGVTLEVAPAHPGLIAATLPWRSARDHKQLVQQTPNMANVVIINRDYYGGRITADKTGEPVLHYELHPYDRAHLQRGVLEGLKVHRAAGAKELYAPHNSLIKYINTGSESDFVRYLRQVEDAGLEPNAFPLFSAHQMSSCRIASSPQQGALKTTGETYEIKNLFVADASALPTATGVNPMVSIMGLAHYIAQNVKAVLN
jgi:choline dehydrogenase-like flavoprotein